MATTTTTTRYDFIENDKRILDQRLRKHKLSQVEYQRLLKIAPDEKDASEELIVYKDSNSSDDAA